MSTGYTIFLGICLLNPTVTNVGLGLQKWAIDRMSHAEKGAKKGVFLWVWAAGLLTQVPVVILSFKALTLGNASTLDGFAGFGMIVLTLFSFFVLKEEILKQELAGMALNLRLKGVGMFWLKHNAEGFLHLRCQTKTGNWDSFLQKTFTAPVQGGIMHKVYQTYWVCTPFKQKSPIFVKL